MTDSVDFPVVGGMASSRCCRQATAAKQQNKKKISCWLLLRWGLRSARQCAFGELLPGYSNTGTTTLQHNKRAASLRWGFAPLANAPFGGGEPPPPEQPEQLPPLPSASPSPVRFRPLPSASPSRSCLS